MEPCADGRSQLAGQHAADVYRGCVRHGLPDVPTI